MNKGYVMVRCDDCPGAIIWGQNDRNYTNRYMFEHRKVMQDFLLEFWPRHAWLIGTGKKKQLSSKRPIHHINHKKTDNGLSNLFIFASQRQHRYYHILVEQRRYEAANEIVKKLMRFNPHYPKQILYKKRGRKAKFEPFAPDID